MTSGQCKITINGDVRVVRATTIALLVQELGIPGATLLVEHNGNALRRDQWESQPLEAGDRIELLRIAAGG